MKYTLTYVESTFSRELLSLSVRRAIYQPMLQSERDDTVNKFIQLLGFNSEHDYIMSLPGNSMSNSNLIKRTIHKGSLTPSKYDHDNITQECLFFAGDFRDDKKMWSVLKNRLAWKDSQITMVERPILEEIRKVYGFKTVDHNRLWFCSDWREGNE